MTEILSKNSWFEPCKCDNCNGTTDWGKAIITLDTRHNEPEYCEIFGDFEHFCPKCAVTLGIHEKRRANFTMDMILKDGGNKKWRKKK